MSDLEKLLPEGKTFTTASGQTILLLPLKFGKFARALSLLAPLSADFGGTEINVTRLMEKHPETVLDLVALMCGKPRVWVDDLQQDEGIALAGACLEVNADFFIRKSLPVAASALLNLAGKLTSPVNPTSSATPETTNGVAGDTSPVA